MISVEELPLRDLFNKYRDPDQFLLIKNVSDQASNDSIQCYIEVILKCEVLALYHDDDIKGSYVVVLDKPVKDFRSYENVLVERKLDGRVIKLSNLGQTNGILIRNVPEEVSDEFLELYFQSPRSGGHDDVVADVKIVDNSNGRMAVVVIDDVTASWKILNQPCHTTLDKYGLNIQPFFPSLHDVLFENQRETNSTVIKFLPTQDTGKDIFRDNWRQQHDHTDTFSKLKNVYEAMTIDSKEVADVTNLANTGQIQLCSSGEPVQKGKDCFSQAQQGHYLKQNLDQQKPKLRRTLDASESPRHKTDSSRIKQSVLPKNKMDSGEKHNASNDDNHLKAIQSLGTKDKDIFVNSENPDKKFDLNKCYNITENDGNSEGVSEQLSFKVQSASQHQLDNTPSSKCYQDLVGKESKNLTAVCACDSSSQNRNFEGKNLRRVPTDSSCDTQQSVKPVTVDLPKTNIILLKINGFVKRCYDCKVTLFENTSQVQFVGTHKAIQTCKLRMYEVLNNTEEKIKCLPKHHVKYISENLGYIKTQLIKNNIGAVISTNIYNSEVRSCAFTAENAELALAFVTNTLVSKKVKLREGQSSLMQGSDCAKIVGNLDKHICVEILENDNSVDIISFDASSVTKTWQSIISYLKASIPKQSIEIVLSGAEARCFKYTALEDLKHTIRAWHGDISCKEGLQEKLTIVVTGDQGLTQLVNDKIKQIWHEKIDFLKITEDAMELSILMKSLATKTTRDYFATFEREHKCFIDVQKKDNQRTTSTKVLRRSNDVPQLPVPEVPHVKHKTTNEKAQEFQLGLSDAEALRLVMETSKLETLGYQAAKHSSQTDKTVYEGASAAHKEKHTAHSITSLGRTEENHMLTKIFGCMKFTLKRGAIATERSQAKVNVVGPSKRLEESVISKAFVAAGGSELVDMFEEAKQQATSNITLTPGCGKLNCELVFHVTLSRKTQHPNKALIPIIQECLRQCNDFGCKYVTFPPLGIGRLYNYPAASVARCMIDEIIRYSKEKTILKEVKIVIYDEETYTVFASMLDDASANVQLTGSYQQQTPIAVQSSSSPHRPATYQTRKSKEIHLDVSKQPIINREELSECGSKQNIRPPNDESDINFKVQVFSNNQSTCTRARNELGKQLKQKFLYRKFIENRGKISDSCRKNIRDVLKKYDVKSVPAEKSRNYIIIGEEKAVTGAYGEILKLLLDEGSSFGITYERKKQKRKELKAKPNEFVKHMAVDYEPEIPVYWKNFKPGATIQNALGFLKTRTKDYIRETLDPQDPIYKAITKLIKHTWDGRKIGQGNDAKGLEQLNYTKMQVTKIQRVENLQLFDKYLHHRKHLFLSMFRSNKTRLTPVESLPGCTRRAQTEDLEKCGEFKDELHPEVNEHFFFHGTAEDAVDVICDTGLDCRLGSHQAMYGPGIYGAESSTKADQYTDSKDKRVKEKRKMFLIRMLLGNCYLCTKHNPTKYRRPPCTNMRCLSDACKEKSHGSFDSVIGQSGRLFREFVVYQAEQCYPEYLITYNRV